MSLWAALFGGEPQTGNLAARVIGYEIPGARKKRADDSYRCGSCSKIQKAGAASVWVPAFPIILSTDPGWYLMEQFSKSCPMGQTLWCEPCVLQVLNNG